MKLKTTLLVNVATLLKQHLDRIVTMILGHLYKKIKLHISRRQYDHKIEQAVENYAKLLWDFHLQTDHLLQHNTPDVTIIKKNNCVDIAKPGNKRIKEKRTGKR